MWRSESRYHAGQSTNVYANPAFAYRVSFDSTISIVGWNPE
jgi:hypothetical protein